MNRINGLKALVQNLHTTNKDREAHEAGVLIFLSEVNIRDDARYCILMMNEYHIMLS